MDSFNETWNQITDYCKENVTEVAYKTWFERIEPVSIDFDNKTVILSVPNDFHKQTIEKFYKPIIDEALKGLFGTTVEIELSVANEDIKKTTINNENEENTDYELTFDNFVVASSNRFAHAAAQAVAAQPGKQHYNPLFIYGNSGLGKTHLLKAISKEIHKNFSDYNIVYIKGDEFTNEMIEAIRSSTTAVFHEKYRYADVFLVDDIQFIGGKGTSQEEFFHTFNTLYESNKQIILTSDRPPKEILALEDRLKTRFEWGLTADIQPPNFETRIAIILRKAESIGITIPENVCDYIAGKLKNNIRQLEGAVKKVKAFHVLEKMPINISTAQLAISDIINNNQPTPVTVEKIVEEVGRTFGVTSEDIYSQNRKATISSARQIAMYIVKEITQISMVEIGEKFGGRDHSTVVYAIKQVDEKIKTDTDIKAKISDITKNIRDR